MEPKNIEAEGYLTPLKRVIPLSKYLAMLLFIIMPFIGGWIGYTWAPEKIVEVDKIVEIEKESKSLSTDYVSGYDVEVPESVEGFYVVQTNEAELTNFIEVNDIYYVVGTYSQFVGQVIGSCSGQTLINEGDNFDQVLDENKQVLQTTDYSLDLEEIIDCGSKTEGDIFISMRLDRPGEIPDSVSVYQRSYNDSGNLSDWNLVIGYHPEGTYLSPPLEHLRNLKSNGIDPEIISDFKHLIVGMY